MKDGSDAIADWAILNALVNSAAGATWVSFHHGGGVGMGYSLHAGMVVVADGTDAARAAARARAHERSGMGVIRHADAGYPRGARVLRGARAARAACSVASSSTTSASSSRATGAGGQLGLVHDAAVVVRNGRVAFAGAARRAAGRARAATTSLDAGGRLVTPGLVDPHTHLVFAGSRAHEFDLRNQGKSYLEIQEAGGGILATVQATRAASDDELVGGARGAARSLPRAGRHRRRGQDRLRPDDRGRAAPARRDPGGARVARRRRLADAARARAAAGRRRRDARALRARASPTS